MSTRARRKRKTTSWSIGVSYIKLPSGAQVPTAETIESIASAWNNILESIGANIQEMVNILSKLSKGLEIPEEKILELKKSIEGIRKNLESSIAQNMETLTSTITATLDTLMGQVKESGRMTREIIENTIRDRIGAIADEMIVRTESAIKEVDERLGSLYDALLAIKGEFESLRDMTKEMIAMLEDKIASFGNALNELLAEFDNRLNKTIEEMKSEIMDMIAKSQDQRLIEIESEFKFLSSRIISLVKKGQPPPEELDALIRDYLKNAYSVKEEQLVNSLHSILNVKILVFSKILEDIENSGDHQLVERVFNKVLELGLDRFYDNHTFREIYLGLVKLASIRREYMERFIEKNPRIIRLFRTENLSRLVHMSSEFVSKWQDKAVRLALGYTLYKLLVSAGIDYLNRLTKDDLSRLWNLYALISNDLKMEVFSNLANISLNVLKFVLDKLSAPETREALKYFVSRIEVDSVLSNADRKTIIDFVAYIISKGLEEFWELFTNEKALLALTNNVSSWEPSEIAEFLNNLYQVDQDLTKILMEKLIESITGRRLIELMEDLRTTPNYERIISSVIDSPAFAEKLRTMRLTNAFNIIAGLSKIIPIDRLTQLINEALNRDIISEFEEMFEVIGELAEIAPDVLNKVMDKITETITKALASVSKETIKRGVSKIISSFPSVVTSITLMVLDSNDEINLKWLSVIIGFEKERDKVFSEELISKISHLINRDNFIEYLSVLRPYFLESDNAIKVFLEGIKHDIPGIIGQENILEIIPLLCRLVEPEDQEELSLSIRKYIIDHMESKNIVLALRILEASSCSDALAQSMRKAVVMYLGRIIDNVSEVANTLLNIDLKYAAQVVYLYWDDLAPIHVERIFQAMRNINPDMASQVIGYMLDQAEFRDRLSRLDIPLFLEFVDELEYGNPRSLVPIIGKYIAKATKIRLTESNVLPVLKLVTFAVKIGGHKYEIYIRLLFKNAISLILGTTNAELMAEAYSLISGNVYLKEIMANVLRAWGSDVLYAQEPKRILGFLEELANRNADATKFMVENAIMEALQNSKYFPTFMSILRTLEPSSAIFRYIIESMPTDLNRSFYLGVDPKLMLELISILMDSNKDKAKLIVADYLNDVGLDPFLHEDIAHLNEYLRILKTSVSPETIRRVLSAQMHQLVSVIAEALKKGIELSDLNMILGSITDIDPRLSATLVAQLDPTPVTLAVIKAYNRNKLSELKIFYGILATLLSSRIEIQSILKFILKTLLGLFWKMPGDTPIDILGRMRAFRDAVLTSKLYAQHFATVASKVLYNKMRNMDLEKFVGTLREINKYEPLIAKKILASIILKKPQDLWSSIETSKLSALADLIDLVVEFYGENAEELVNKIYESPSRVLRAAMSNSNVEDIKRWIMKHRDIGRTIPSEIMDALVQRITDVVSEDNFESILGIMSYLKELDENQYEMLIGYADFQKRLVEVLLAPPESDIIYRLELLIHVTGERVHMFINRLTVEDDLFTRFVDLEPKLIVEFLFTLTNNNVYETATLLRQFANACQESQDLLVKLVSADLSLIGRLFIVSVRLNVPTAIYDVLSPHLKEMITGAQTLRSIIDFILGFEQLPQDLLSNADDIRDTLVEKIRSLLPDAETRELINLLMVLVDHIDKSQYNDLIKSMTNTVKERLRQASPDEVGNVIVRLSEKRVSKKQTDRIRKLIGSFLGDKEILNRLKQLPSDTRSQIASMLESLDKGLAKKLM